MLLKLVSTTARLLIYLVFLFPVAFAEEAFLDLGEPTEQELDAMIDSIEVSPNSRPLKVPAKKVAPAPAPVKKTSAAPKKKVNRKISSFTQGFLRTKKDCSFRAQPTANAQRLMIVKRGKKLWLESDSNSGWMKGGSSKGPGYLSPSCF